MSSSFAAIKPAIKLSDQVASALEAEIREGRIQAGDKLPTEAALAQQFEVSRTVVREAISRLKSLGLVDSRPGSGVYLAKFDRDVFKQGFGPELHGDIVGDEHGWSSNAWRPSCQSSDGR